MIKFIQAIWELPQTILGLILFLYLNARGVVTGVQEQDGRIICRQSAFGGGISLGGFVFVHTNTGAQTIDHELGHCKQSLYLGPIYLIVIGIPSICWATYCTYWAATYDYYAFYTERWADKLAGIER